MRVRTLVVDDEPVARAGLRTMLTAFDWVEVVGEAADGEAAVEAIRRLQPELVFLDVQMPGLTGTDVLRRLERQPFVVFTTAYSQHAVTAFELGAVDYLLKPFGPGRLAAALGGEPISRLFVRVGGALVPVAVETVCRFEAIGDYVAAHAGRTRRVLDLSLNRLESRLDPNRFARVHRSHIVNLDHVRAFRRDARGNLEAEMADGTLVPVSRARAQVIRGAGL
jgi:two-component system, LytTR family, response regulator